MKKLYQILNINKDIYIQVNSFSIGKIGKSVVIYDSLMQPKQLVRDPWKISPIFDKGIDFVKLYKGDIIVDVERDEQYYTVNVVEVDWFHDYYTEGYILDKDDYLVSIEKGKVLASSMRGGNY